MCRLQMRKWKPEKRRKPKDVRNYLFLGFVIVKKRKFIQSFFGWVLLSLFTLSITPRQLLHDALAHHTDQAIEFSGNAFISKPGFNCDRLNLVAESPFTEADTFTETVPLQPGTDFIVISNHKAAPKAITLPGLRGPPCI